MTDPEEFRGRRIVIIGGGDTAFDWAHQLLDRAASVTLVHRSDRFRAHAATVSEVESAAAQGRAQLLTFHELADITSTGDQLSGVVLKDIKGKTTRALEADAILPMLGFVSDLAHGLVARARDAQRVLCIAARAPLRVFDALEHFANTSSQVRSGILFMKDARDSDANHV